MAETYTTGHCAHKNAPGGCQLHNLQCGYPECDRKAAAPPPMPVDPLEDARERLEAALGALQEAVLETRGTKADADRRRTLQAVRAVSRAILAELDRRSPPTREGEEAMAGLLRKTWHDFRYPPRGTPPGPEDADVFDAMAAALSAPAGGEKAP
jgi:hypothetical protein